MVRVQAAGLTGTSVFSSFQYRLVLYALTVTMLALLASFVYSLVQRHEVSKKYRPAVIASAIITLVAALSYGFVVSRWLAGWSARADEFVPDLTDPFSDTYRYGDWTVTVPLLGAELLAVTTLAGTRLRNARGMAMASAAAMIVTGLLGQLADEGPGGNTAAVVVWGLVSTAFFLVLYAVLGAAVRTSLRELPVDAAVSLRNATILLFSVFGVYPLVYLVFVFLGEDRPNWAVTVQLAFCSADVAAKVGFGALIHKVAKLRTAHDANTGESRVPDGWPQEVYLSHEKLSEPRSDGPPATAPADGEAVTRRPRRP
jgi:bacteriorhodopsin